MCVKGPNACMYSKHNGEEEEYVLLFLFKVVMWYSKNTWNVLQIMLQYLLTGAADPGGPGGAGPPLEFGIY